MAAAKCWASKRSKLLLHGYLLLWMLKTILYFSWLRGNIFATLKLCFSAMGSRKVREIIDILCWVLYQTAPDFRMVNGTFSKAAWVLTF